VVGTIRWMVSAPFRRGWGSDPTKCADIRGAGPVSPLDAARPARAGHPYLTCFSPTYNRTPQFACRPAEWLTLCPVSKGQSCLFPHGSIRIRKNRWESVDIDSVHTAGALVGSKNSG